MLSVSVTPPLRGGDFPAIGGFSSDVGSAPRRFAPGRLASLRFAPHQVRAQIPFCPDKALCIPTFLADLLLI